MQQTIKNRLLKMETELNHAIKMDYDNLQSWYVLLDWKVGETRNINGTASKKTFANETNMEFEVLMPPESNFPIHWHDFHEHIQVLEGVYTDIFHKEEYVAGEEVNYKKGVVHEPTNKQKYNLLLKVKFTL